MRDLLAAHRPSGARDECAGTLTAAIAHAPAVAAAAVALFVATLAWRFLTFTGFSNDHYAHFALAQQLLLGERPIRDFTDPGWPLTYMLSAGTWQLAGDAMCGGVGADGPRAGDRRGVHAPDRAPALRLTLDCRSRHARSSSSSIPRTYSYPKLLAYAVGAWAHGLRSPHGPRVAASSSWPRSSPRRFCCATITVCISASPRPSASHARRVVVTAGGHAARPHGRAHRGDGLVAAALDAVRDGEWRARGLFRQRARVRAGGSQRLQPAAVAAARRSFPANRCWASSGPIGRWRRSMEPGHLGRRAFGVGARDTDSNSSEKATTRAGTTCADTSDANLGCPGR